tara:strand:- start:212 stop:385 length:174 start_codon:yes stop_codon:yes gene_type:complete
MKISDTIILMTLGIIMMLASIVELLTNVMHQPFLTILVGITGFVTFWSPIIVDSFEN